MDLVRKLVGAKTVLSPLGMAAAGLWYRWHNDMTVGLLAGSPGHRSPGSIEEIQQTIDGYLKARDRAHVFVIADLATDRPIGWCALFVADAANRRATLSPLIGRRSTGDAATGRTRSASCSRTASSS